MDLPPEITWNEEVKKRINAAVAEEVGRIRICQKVFPTRHLSGSPLNVPNDALALPNITIPEGLTKQFVELDFRFAVTVAQARNEPESMTCQTLSRMAAKAIALAEDMIIFQGQTAGGQLPAGVLTSQLPSAANGLLGAAQITIRVPRVAPPGPAGTPIWGQHVFAAVANGIAQLVRMGQAPDYALFLPTPVYADTYVPVGGGLTITADRIRPLVEGGFYGTGVLPDNQGLLAALGGQPTVIYMGNEAQTEYIRRDRIRYFFLVTERFQFVAVDPRALVRLEFEQQAGARPQAQSNNG
jgi:uncharacterized linocin/CFP29 family protein